MLNMNEMDFRICRGCTNDVLKMELLCVKLVAHVFST